jgi:hypothetical protein
MDKFFRFILICVVLRFFIAMLALYLSEDAVKMYMSPITFIISIVFMILYIFNLRQVAPEAIGNTVWWSQLRIVHSIFYLLFAITSYHKSKNAWIFLLLDVIFGLTSHIHQHKLY